MRVNAVFAVLHFHRTVGNANAPSQLVTINAVRTFLPNGVANVCVDGTHDSGAEPALSLDETGYDLLRGFVRSGAAAQFK